MTTPTTTTFVGAKGGVGTTTVAALHAVQLARLGCPVRLSAIGPAGVDDLAAVVGLPTPGPGTAADDLLGLTLAEGLDPAVDNVVDGGTGSFSDHHGCVYVVLRNDYLCVRRALNVPQTTPASSSSPSPTS